MIKQELRPEAEGQVIKISELVENNEQTMQDAIVNVKDGLDSKTEGPVLARRENGKLVLGDGYHRVAQAILAGKKEIEVRITGRMLGEIK